MLKKTGAFLIDRFKNKRVKWGKSTKKSITKGGGVTALAVQASIWTMQKFPSTQALGPVLLTAAYGMVIVKILEVLKHQFGLKIKGIL